MNTSDIYNLKLTHSDGGTSCWRVWLSNDDDFNLHDRYMFASAGDVDDLIGHDHYYPNEQEWLDTWGSELCTIEVMTEEETFLEML